MANPISVEFGRKVRCDKAVPCSTCIRRGEAELCVRETVIVRGNVTVAQDSDQQPTYEQLLVEIALLRQQQVPPQPQPHILPVPSQQLDYNAVHLTVERSRALDETLFQSAAPHLPTSNRIGWDSIILPSTQCSIGLVEYDKIWNSWVHYAIEYPQFEHEHNRFLLALQSGTPLHEYDASWLAIYFSVITAALLTMDDEEANQLGLLALNYDYTTLLRNWYDASLFCLHQADFMRRLDMRTVQAVAILGICFVNFGDKHLYESIWACAFSIAQRLGLDQPGVSAADGMSQEARRRLWWTLVICDWLQVPYRIPIVRDGDFDVDLPSVEGNPRPIGSDGRSIHPVHYHTFMARCSRVWHRFQAALRTTAGAATLDDTVRRADCELAEIIDTLPHYLQPDRQYEADELEATYPWIVWQRFDITLVLLHLRLRANQVLRDTWSAKTTTRTTPMHHPYSWARSLCIATARELIWICHHWHQPVTKRRQWALSFYVFNAARHLVEECLEWSTTDMEKLAWRSDVAVGMAYLEAIQSHNVIAQEGVQILKGLLQ
ncbi:c6 zinc finger domain containing protein [Grosmannia clavigera kw1407]|uniref:C6 zinc finger domain containing protein n=1 Tax=Grosmannia clavigera (strain kw1407 / UAMH 11150) TaxID=655863 RepID=F0XBJ4_GROCL|nr:c6 zinc finger domain containing protein [Grosmannia clavigera kw1407]EFX04942.1 c6 zinc finger domain containing protein [Grosmannia clavigera kw1407]